MVDGVAAAHAANRLSAGNAHAQREDIVGADILDLRKVDTVFVAEREIAKEVFEGVNAALGEEFGALWADTFDHLDIGLQAVSHKGSYSQKRWEVQNWLAGLFSMRFSLGLSVPGFQRKSHGVPSLAATHRQELGGSQAAATTATQDRNDPQFSTMELIRWLLARVGPV
jgi:hypothetical protein